jgi:hypothetical protein
MKTKIRNGVVVGALVLGSSVTTLTVAQASGYTNSSTSVNTLTSARCYHHHGSRVTNFRWVSADRRYEAYSSPHRSTTDYNTCHK